MSVSVIREINQTSRSGPNEEDVKSSASHEEKTERCGVRRETRLSYHSGFPAAPSGCTSKATSWLSSVSIACANVCLVTSMSEEGLRKLESSKPPEIVVKTKAFQVAQAWVKNMTGGLDPEPEEEDDDEDPTAREGFGAQRPARLGLGAKYLPHSHAAMLMSPVEKKLRARINAAARKEADSAADREETPTLADGDDGGNDSKTSAFGRKHRNTSADLLMMPTGKAGKRKRPGR